METPSLPQSGGQLDLYRRSSVPAVARDRQISTIERLRALDNADKIKEVTIHPWETKIPVGESQRKKRETHHVHDAFRDWAHERGVTLSPFFQTRECHSSTTGKSYTALVLPVLCLAVTTGDRLHAVFPHKNGERTHTVGDALDALETEDS